MANNFLPSLALVSALAFVPAASAALAPVDVNSYRELDQFMTVLDQVKANYVDRVDDQTLIRGAIDGMLASLDPHSSYMDAREYRNLMTTTDGNYGGLGLVVTMKDGAVQVVAPTEDTPAARAGIKSGDFITHLDGKFIVGGSLDEAIEQMRGKPGTSITLTVVRPGADKPLQFTLVRETIIQKPVKWEVKDGVGYININTFTATTTADTRKAIEGINKQLGHAPLGYVVDLRENGVRDLLRKLHLPDDRLQRIRRFRGLLDADLHRALEQLGDHAVEPATLRVGRVALRHSMSVGSFRGDPGQSTTITEGTIPARTVGVTSPAARRAVGFGVGRGAPGRPQAAVVRMRAIPSAARATDACC